MDYVLCIILQLILQYVIVFSVVDIQSFPSRSPTASILLNV